MEEKVIINDADLPESVSEEIKSGDEATIPNADNPVNDKTDFLEVKFNKEITKLDRQTAVAFAQKGMKYDLVSADYERLKALSKNSGKSVSDYLLMLEGKEKNEQIEKLLNQGLEERELVDRVLQLKEEAKTDELALLKAEFPGICDESELPCEVKTAAEMKGTGLLFEYLLHEHRLHRAAEEEKQRQLFSAVASTGSLSENDRQNAFDAEFIKGLWGR
ncbi:MAG: hypothetical protein J6Q67_03300 [Clostridia bacterium]|nr:hypothetical protein [Clostridia bacterium]